MDIKVVGLDLAKNVFQVHGRAIPEVLEAGENGLSPLMRGLIAGHYERWCALERHIAEHTRQLEQQAREQQAGWPGHRRRGACQQNGPYRLGAIGTRTAHQPH